MEAIALVSDWILLTYDLPADRAKERAEFLKRAKWLGAVQHTESVYIMPNTTATLRLVEELSQISHAFVWFSKPSDEERARELTDRYDDKVKLWLLGLEERIKKVRQRMEEGKQGAARMIARTTYKEMQKLEDIIERRGNVELMIELVVLMDKLKAVLLGPEEG